MTFDSLLQQEIWENGIQLGIFGIQDKEDIITLNCSWNPNVAIVVNKILWCAIRIVVKLTDKYPHQLKAIKICQCLPGSVGRRVQEIRNRLEADDFSANDLFRFA
jgi:hypothetical protein